MWTADLGNGRYKNPILYADYSDPDAIRVGDDYFMISSSFSNAPAMPLLHSKDLVNWKVVNYILAEIPEFRYRNPLVTEKSLVIVISQSGETADTLAALRNSKNIGATIIALTNVVGSSVSREADHVLYTLAGPEISVASTKAYTTQIIGMYMMAMTFAAQAKTVKTCAQQMVKSWLLLELHSESEVQVRKLLVVLQLEAHSHLQRNQYPHLQINFESLNFHHFQLV